MTADSFPVVLHSSVSFGNDSWHLCKIFWHTLSSFSIYTILKIVFPSCLLLKFFNLIIYDNICRICTLHSICASPRWVCCDFPASSQSRCSVSPAQISEMMSHFLKRHDQTLASGEELLPTLKSICGQVSKLRLDDAAMETESQMLNGAWWVHPRLFRQHLSATKIWSMCKNCS